LSSINPEKFYKKVYSMIDTTPLITDCGRICGHICCSVSDAGEGMYLFPYERVMFGKNTPFAKVCECDFVAGGKAVDFLTCDGRCERDARPLACRIFPLVPYVTKEGELKVIFDPRAVGFCPLENKKITRKFKKQVRNVALLLFKVSDTREFLIAQSRLIDEYYLEKRGF